MAIDARMQSAALEQAAKVEDGRLVGNAIVEGGELEEVAEAFAVVYLFLHHRVAQCEPLLQAVNFEHERQRITRGAAIGLLRVARLDERAKLHPWGDLVHLREKLVFAKRLPGKGDGEQTRRWIGLVHGPSSLQR